jgi:hypothetical protein
MNSVLFQDRTTSHRALISNVRRVVHARYDHEENFIRFLVLRTLANWHGYMISAIGRFYCATNFA